MNAPLVAICLVAVTGIVVAAMVLRPPTETVPYDLRFDRRLTSRDVEAFLSALSGVREPWWRAWTGRPVIVFEVHADVDGLCHRLVAPKRYLDVVESTVRAHLPGVRFDVSANGVLSTTFATSYSLSEHYRPLSVTSVVPAGLLQALSSSPRNGAATLQWLITPNGPSPVPVHDRGEGRAISRRGLFPTADAASAARQKFGSPTFRGVLRLGVSDQDAQRARTQLRQLEAPLHAANAPGVHFQRQPRPKRQVARQLDRRAAPGGLDAWPILINVTELAGLLAWPVDGTTVPGLRLSGCRQLPVSAALPTAGIVVGDGTTAGTARPVAIDLAARFRHLTIIGATGVGKTSLLTRLALGDIDAGHGVLAVDPKGSDLVDGVLERLDPRHWDRVVILDPSDWQQPVGFNPLRPQGVHPELAVEHVVATMRRVWAQSWGVRSDDIIRMALRTLVVDADATVVDLIPLLTDPAFRRPPVEQTTDPSVRGFWRQYEALSDSERTQWIAPVLNKLRALVARPGLRRMVGQAHPSVDVAAHLNGGGIVLVPLNAGRIGEDAAALFGALLVGTLWDVVQGRERHGGRHRPLMVFLDELARYAHLPIPIEELLSQARSFGVGITTAFQHLGQLTPELRHAVLANPRSRIAFQVGATDARILATEFGQGLTAEDLVGLEPFEVVAQLFAAGRTQPAATLTTRALEPPTQDHAAVHEATRDRWGVDGDAVDAALNQRHHPDDPALSPGPVGRKRRRS